MTPQQRKEVGEKYYRHKHKSEKAVQPTPQERCLMGIRILEAELDYVVFVVDEEGFCYRERLVSDTPESNMKRFRKFIGG